MDLIPMLNKSPGVYTKIIEPGGWLMFMVLNHLNPPFDNLKVRQAVLLAMDQQSFVESVVGDQRELAIVPTGLFAPTMPMSNNAGLEKLTTPRDLAKAKQMIATSGYAGEPVVLMSPSDQPALKQMSEVARELFERIGLKVDYQETDFGSVVTRRASQNPISQGGWGAFVTQMSPLTAANPGSMLSLRGNGRKGWFGWPTDEKIEQLREAWFDAPDLATEKSMAEQIQQQYFETVPFLVLCRMRYPMALRTDIQDVVSASFPMFWAYGGHKWASFSSAIDERPPLYAQSHSCPGMMPWHGPEISGSVTFPASRGPGRFSRTSKDGQRRRGTVPRESRRVQDATAPPLPLHRKSLHQLRQHYLPCLPAIQHCLHNLRRQQR